MSYSCSDFTDDVLAAFIKRGLFAETSVEDDDPEQQAQLVIGALDDLLKQFKELEARASVLPIANGTTCVDPDAKGAS